MPKSKFFRVATEGDTTDGRKIERSWIQDMADTYNPVMYGARVNLEHIRGVTPASPFKALGDVTALKAQPVENGKLGLFAQIDPTADLVAMNHARQKIYSSVEVSPNFANTGKAYMVGLAVTDSPASLGTDVLSFAASHPDLKMFDGRKVDPANLFSAAAETKIEMEADAPPANDFATIVTTALTKLFGDKPQEQKVEPPKTSTPADAAQLLGAMQASMTELFTGLGTKLDTARAEDSAKITKLTADLAALTTSVETTRNPQQQQRPPAAGAGQFSATDC